LLYRWPEIVTGACDISQKGRKHAMEIR